MKKINRIRKNEEFKEVLNNHKCVSRENFKIFTKENNLQYTRVGVSVSSKIGNSVVRHRVKRQIVAMLDKCLDFNEGLDIVVIARDKFIDKVYQENYETICDCLNKILRKEKQ